MPAVPNLRALRQRALLTQEELAQRAGIARSTLIALERGDAEARPSTVRKLATVLGVDPLELLPPPERQ